mmetsp:Transcript_30035/g.72921  ORF Transcript_30035/g.72921 Transcript_30035/m.72921 type:complete len:237 (-) Transcript_30035:1437-2147(-)
MRERVRLVTTESSIISARRILFVEQVRSSCFLFRWLHDAKLLFSDIAASSAASHVISVSSLCSSGTLAGGFVLTCGFIAIAPLASLDCKVWLLSGSSKKGIENQKIEPFSCCPLSSLSWTPVSLNPRGRKPYCPPIELVRVATEYRPNPALSVDSSDDDAFALFGRPMAASLQEEPSTSPPMGLNNFGYCSTGTPGPVSSTKNTIRRSSLISVSASFRNIFKWTEPVSVHAQAFVK